MSAGSGHCSADHTYTAAGVYTVGIVVSDDTGSTRRLFEYVVVYDPSAGFVTGGGWINSPRGACAANPDMAGKATFDFVSRYQKGMTIPTGQTQFQLQSASFNFRSSLRLTRRVGSQGAI